MLSPLATQVLAICVLSLIGLGLLTWAVIRVRRSPFTPARTGIYVLLYLIVRILWRAQIVGRLPIPPGRGAVVICNHRGPLDSFSIALSVDRLVHWMVAREYCIHPAFAWFLRICEAIPVSRGGIDTAATKLAIRYARQGELVGLFPEGRINTTDELLAPGRPGAAMIALKAQVPVVPCFISGSPYDGTVWGCQFMPAKIRLKIGQPMDLSEYYGRDNDREALEDLTRRFLVEIARLAGCPDFQPKLAGRFYKPGLADE
jgi:1-acyl-sn-glycerol-3-phosphate acyltransferase